MDVPPSPAFCTRCGGAWDAVSGRCPRCAAASSRPRAEGAARPGRHLFASLSLYFTLLLISAASIIAHLAGADGAHVMFITSAVSSAAVVLWVLPLFRRLSPGLKSPVRGYWFPLSVGLGCATFAVAMFAVKGLGALLELETRGYSDVFLSSGYGWGMIILLVCVQPAIFEELAFRGVILESLRGFLKNREAVIVSAMLFMVLHLAVLGFPHLLIMGLALGYLRLRTGSIYPCMVLHFTHNFLVVLNEMAGW